MRDRKGSQLKQEEDMGGGGDVACEQFWTGLGKFSQIYCKQRAHCVDQSSWD